MISKIAKITLYVNSQEEAKRFWVNKVGFTLLLEQKVGDVHWLEVTPSKLAGTTFVLYDKKQMQQENPNISVGAPSVILSSGDIAATHEHLKKNGVKVEQLMKLPYGSMFQFYDQDGNEFLVRDDG